MTLILCGALLVCGAATLRADPEASYAFNYANDVQDEYFQHQVNFMASNSKKTPHLKGNSGAFMRPPSDSWFPLDIGKYDASNDDVGDHNRLKRRAKRVRRFNAINGPKLRERPHHYLYPEPVKDRILEFTSTTKRPSILPDQMNPGVIFRQQRKRSRSQRRRGRQRGNGSAGPDEEPKTVSNASAVPVARRSDVEHRQKKKGKSGRGGKTFDAYDPPVKEWESSFVEMPKDLYQAHLRPGVIFRIHMSEAILKMQYRAYGEDKDESVIEADVEYLRLTRKVINDEITKFEDLRWLVGWFSNRSDLIVEHTCNTRYFAVGTPPTMFTHSEEYMKRLCLFDNVYIDHIPYVIGEDSSLMAAVAPPVLHCDASTCTSVPFIDSVMFDEKLARTNVRTVTRCQASCRAHCRNDPDCLKRCSDRCMHGD